MGLSWLRHVLVVREEHPTRQAILIWEILFITLGAMGGSVVYFLYGIPESYQLHSGVLGSQKDGMVFIVLQIFFALLLIFACLIISCFIQLSSNIVCKSVLPFRWRIDHISYEYYKLVSDEEGEGHVPCSEEYNEHHQ